MRDKLFFVFEKKELFVYLANTKLNMKSDT